MPTHTQKEYTSAYTPTWCPGCGNFSIYPATKMAFAALGLEPHQIAMIFDIGCSSNGSNFYHLYSFHGIHGRALPVAVGTKLANTALTVVADAGDGGAFGEGMSHFIHTARTNIDLTYLVHDNHLYSLTTGQTSPTSGKGMKTKSSPHGVIEGPFNPLATALINGATFVAQGFSADIPHLASLIQQAITHKGFAYINILQLCPTFNKLNDLNWYKTRAYKLEAEQHDPSNYQAAINRATATDGRLPLGILYRVDAPTYESQFPVLANGPLAQRKVKPVDISRTLQGYQ